MPDGGRVIAGIAGGTRLAAGPPGTRPLADRVKQALFASLEADGALDGPLLDLFAGTGAAGIEALSRGAPVAIFVERDAKAARVIAENLARTRLSGGDVVRDDVERYLGAGRPADQSRFSAVVVDPPYDAQLLEPALARLGDSSAAWLADGALVVAKHFWRDAPAERFGALVVERVRRFGETSLTFYRHTVE